MYALSKGDITNNNLTDKQYLCTSIFEICG